MTIYRLLSLEMQFGELGSILRTCSELPLSALCYPVRFRTKVALHPHSQCCDAAPRSSHPTPKYREGLVECRQWSHSTRCMKNSANGVGPFVEHNSWAKNPDVLHPDIKSAQNPVTAGRGGFSLVCKAYGVGARHAIGCVNFDNVSMRTVPRTICSFFQNGTRQIGIGKA